MSPAKRCQWRPVSGVDMAHLHHMPTDCRTCWKPCFQHPTVGLHCDECFDLLATHGNARVRAALANEDEVPRDILELLSSDLQPSVSGPAERRLKQMGPVADARHEAELDLWDW